MDLPILPPDYRPSDKEPYMSPLQLAYFRQKLVQWEADLLNESEDTLAALQEQSLSTPEAVERASMETDHAFELRARDRARKLINKIDQAIARVGGARAEIGAMWWRHETRRRVHGRGVGVLSQRLAALSAADIAAEVSQLKQAQGGLESVAKVRAAQQSLYGETLLALLG